ncbi:hypothetical protein QAD02_006764 [Eretmocerus hayati]|uniref:Uncharacterized protein n=1 Tax=Eretmocerus hayati TaxID=131215 RepID=A0ACC2N1T7_9HYME|nr:hypothetical protein QAD02_006764 [Eretmocerus hayati]
MDESSRMTEGCINDDTILVEDRAEAPSPSSSEPHQAMFETPPEDSEEWGNHREDMEICSPITDPPSSAEIKTAKLNEQKTRIFVDQYQYWRFKRRSDKIRWHCTKHGSHKCRAKVTTGRPLETEDTVIVIALDNSHNHPPEIESDSGVLQGVTGLGEVTTSNVPNAVSNTILGDKISSKSSKNPGFKLCYISLYRKFLLKFSENPKFDTEHILKALHKIYSSKTNLSSAIMRILEYQEKITRDLKTLEKSPNAQIIALDRYDHRKFNKKEVPIDCPQADNGESTGGTTIKDTQPQTWRTSLRSKLQRLLPKQKKSDASQKILDSIVTRDTGNEDSDKDFTNAENRDSDRTKHGETIQSSASTDEITPVQARAQDSDNIPDVSTCSSQMKNISEGASNSNIIENSAQSDVMFDDNSVEFFPNFDGRLPLDLNLEGSVTTGPSITPFAPLPVFNSAFTIPPVNTSVNYNPLPLASQSSLSYAQSFNQSSVNRCPDHEEAMILRRKVEHLEKEVLRRDLQSAQDKLFAVENILLHQAAASRQNLATTACFGAMSSSMSSLSPYYFNNAQVTSNNVTTLNPTQAGGIWGNPANQPTQSYQTPQTGPHFFY